VPPRNDKIYLEAESMELRTLAERVAEKFPVRERDLRRTFEALLTTDNLWEVLDLTDIPIMTFCEVWKELAQEGLVEVKDSSLRLTPKGRELAAFLEITPIRDFACPRCKGRGIEIEPLKEVAEKFKAIARSRPEAIRDYDQGYVLEEVTVARVALMWQKGDLAGLNLMVLGDDDLVSVAASLTGAPKRVTVIDIDERLLDFIQKVSDKEGLKIQVLKHDLRYPLPEELQGAFDTFITDPTESFKGMKAFLSRSLSCLKGPGSAGYFGFTRREASLKKWQAIQKFLLEKGAVITDIIDDFNVYANWPYMESMRAWEHLPARALPQKEWYKSAHYRIELLEKPGPDTEVFPVDLYDEETATV
jgi:predicted methyltransferase